MLRDSRPDLLVEAPSTPSGFRPGIRVCPWGAGDGRIEVVLVTRSRQRVAQVFCDPERLDAVKAELQRLWEILEPEAAKPHLHLMA